MDIIAHALLTNLVFKDLPWQTRRWAIVLGVLPDIIGLCGIYNNKFFRKRLFFKKPPAALVPTYVKTIYAVMHSIPVWLTIFLGLRLLAPDWSIIWCAWGLHIMVDIFTHSDDSMMAAPVFWPFTNYSFNGMKWSNKWFLLFNYCLLLFLYLFFYP